jgi:hypothetical protein
MTRDEILAYARRDWAAVEAAKFLGWAEERSLRSAGEALGMAGALREAVRRLRPDWPSREERDRDLAEHVELSRRLRRVHPRSCR